ncbi:MAG: CTP synthase, partial [Oscillospiraceae bacterium]|nr:CTP synthase [Oscillospiraceae bacterium]
NGDYCGGTVQVIPHITNEIKACIYKVGASGEKHSENPHTSDTNIVITEIGGTVGDIESTPFLEAIRQVIIEAGRENAMCIHVTLMPYITGSHELKSKPTQHSVKELLSQGIVPGVIVCRSETEIPLALREKISLFCNVRKQDVIQNLTAGSLYEVPLLLENEGLADCVCRHLSLENRTPDLSDWIKMTDRQKAAKGTVTVGLVGKYVSLPDAYLSLAEALRHGGIEDGVNVEIKWIDAEELSSSNADEILSGCDGICVPGAFGERGTAGMIKASCYARQNKVPYLGIGMGMQMAVVEFARNVAGIKDADSREFNENGQNNVIIINGDVPSKGGTMRLGLCPCKLEKDSRAYEIYGRDLIEHRHRHRFEFNNEYRKVLAEHGMVCTGISPDGSLVEIIEIPEHPWFIGVQFHPEFKSRPNKPEKLFISFINAAKTAASPVLQG